MIQETYIDLQNIEHSRADEIINPNTAISLIGIIEDEKIVLYGA
jgi:hypothetical protein